MSYSRFAEDLSFLQPTPGTAVTSSRQLTEQIVAAHILSLIISGGHNAAFEKICDVLAEMLGGERAVISGYGHAPQQSGEPFNTCLERFWSQHSS